jgi:hypothetical protein
MSPASDLTSAVACALTAGGSRLAEQVRSAAAALEGASVEVRAQGEASLRRGGEALRLAILGKISPDDCEAALAIERDTLETLALTMGEVAGAEGIKRTKAVLEIIRTVVIPIIVQAAAAAV